MQQNFDQYENLNPKVRLHKRSILPIVGQALSALFGVVSENDLENVNRNIKHLALNQKQIVHDLHVGLSVLNLTRTQVSENRRALLDVVVCVNKLDGKIRELKILLEKKKPKSKKEILQPVFHEKENARKDADDNHRKFLDEQNAKCTCGRLYCEC